MRLRYALRGSAIALWVCSLSAGPTIVTMQSGERVIGQVSEKSDAATLVLHSELLGVLKLPRAQVVSEESFEPVDTSLPKAKDPILPEEEAISYVEERRWVERFLDLQAPEAWNGNLRLGVNLSQGDSKWIETFARGNLTIDPEGSKNFYRYVGSYTYRQTERNGEELTSTDRYDANFTFRRDLTEHWFLQNSIGGRVDQVKGIEHEVQELLGAGVRLKPGESVELILGAGAGVEDFEADFEDSRSGLNPVANLYQELSWVPFEKATLTQEFSYFVNPEESEQYNYVFSAAFRYRLTDLFGLEFSFHQSFDNDLGNGNSKEDTRWQNAIILYF
ncbi:MAG: DUF481 domain-containing protein [Opitutales bacterium]